MDDSEEEFDGFTKEDVHPNANNVDEHVGISLSSDSDESEEELEGPDGYSHQCLVNFTAVAGPQKYTSRTFADSNKIVVQ